MWSFRVLLHLLHGIIGLFKFSLGVYVSVQQTGDLLGGVLLFAGIGSCNPVTPKRDPDGRFFVLFFGSGWKDGWMEFGGTKLHLPNICI